MFMVVFFVQRHKRCPVGIDVRFIYLYTKHSVYKICVPDLQTS